MAALVAVACGAPAPVQTITAAESSSGADPPEAAASDTIETGSGTAGERERIPDDGDPAQPPTPPPATPRAPARLAATPLPVIPSPTADAPAPATTTETPPIEPPPTVTPTPLPPTATASATAGPSATVPEPTLTPVPTITPPPTVDPQAPTATPGPSPTPIARTVAEQAHAVFAVVSGIELRLPSTHVELLGWHQAGHTGSRDMTDTATVPTLVMDDRGRDTGARTAADIVVDPTVEIVAPVTGTVIAANTYVLYCEHTDELIYIEPDGLPGFELKIFHVVGTRVAIGDRVVAGETRLADSSRILPFESQVDEFTAEPSWPHIHIELVDTSIPDERPPGAGCS